MVSSTPSRVTRSSSRQPERSSSSAASSSSKKKSSTKKSSGSNKKSSDSAKKSSSSAKKKQQSRDATPDTPRRTTSSSSNKKSTPSKSTSGGYTTSDNGASVADELIRTTGRAARKSVAAASKADEEEPVASSTPQPLVALLPHILVNAGLVGLAHFLVSYEFARSSVQAAVVADLKSCWCTQWIDTKYLAFSDAHDLGFWLVVPLYVIAGLLLRWGVALVVGPSNRSAAFAANLARVISGAFFLATVYAQCCLGAFNSYESLNALFVLRFAFIFQEFLLNFQQFTTVRRAYSLISLVVTGYLGYNAFALEHLTGEVPAAPALIVATAWTLQVAQGSNNLGALAQVFSFLGSGFLATVVSALQAVVNFGIVPILSVSLYSRNAALFTGAGATTGTTSFLESSAASLLLVALVFLLWLDSYSTPSPADVQVKKRV